MREIFVVYDEYTAVRVTSGSLNYCLNYIKTHDGAYYIEED
jgi:hypothetical protein